MKRIGRSVVAISCLFGLSTYAGESTPSDQERVVLVHPAWPTAESFSAQRVTVLVADLLEKEGASMPVEALREIPVFVGTTATENDSNGGNGTARINLYALGSNNVVTLINLRRAFGFSDINAIPISAISRIEIIDAGIYGSDSAGGVVNFIMLDGPGEKPYEGAELHASYGNTTDSDAHVRQVYLRGGVLGLDGKVSIAVAAEYYSRANLFARDREISRSGDLSNDATGLGFGGPNQNSPTFAGRISLAGLPPAGGGQRVLIDLTENAPTPASYRVFDVPPGTDPSRFNFRAYTPAIPALEKARFFVAGRYKTFGDGLQLYGDLLHSKTKQDNAISPTPISFTSVANGLGEVRSSPFNPFPGSTLTSLRYRTLQELGLRRSFYDRDNYRYTVGLNGDFNPLDNELISRFGYDSEFVYERTDQLRTDSGDLTLSGIRNQIRLGVFDPFIGQFAPPVGIAPTYANGIPSGTSAYNNIAGARAASYIGGSFSYERDWLADTRLNAHLFPKWWNGGFDLSAVYERREINQKQSPDPVQASGDSIGFDPTAPGRYRQEVETWSFQLSFPLIVSTMGVPWLHSLDLEMSWVREEFADTNLLLVPGSPRQTASTFVNENPDENFGGSPQVSLRYQPNPDVMVRASWRQSTRPPTFAERFTPIRQIFPVILGPGIGIPPLPNNGIFVGGDPALLPENTDAYSAGIVWSPSSVPGLTLTADAYQIFTQNVIVDPDSFTRTILATETVDPDGCGLGTIPGGGPGLGLTRALDGTLDCIDSTYSNAGKRFVEGLELTANYEIAPDRFGLFIISGGWNHFFAWKGQAGPGNPTKNFLGNYDNRTLPFAPGAIPWNKGFLRCEWKLNGFQFTATGNYIGDFRDDPSFDSVVREERRNVPSYITLDLQLSYEWKKPEPDWTNVRDARESAKSISSRTDSSGPSVSQRLLFGTKITVGVNNAFDRNPPTVLAAANDNYDTSLYSIRNRYWYVAVSKKF